MCNILFTISYKYNPIRDKDSQDTWTNFSNKKIIWLGLDYFIPCQMWSQSSSQIESKIIRTDMAPLRYLKNRYFLLTPFWYQVSQNGWLLSHNILSASIRKNPFWLFGTYFIDNANKTKLKYWTIEWADKKKKNKSKSERIEDRDRKCLILLTDEVKNQYSYN